MSNIRQDTIFPGTGLDRDSDYHYIKNGDAPWRLNILPFDEQAGGVICQMEGCHKGAPSYVLTNSDVYIVVGSYYNRLTRKVYYFVFGLPYESDLSDEFLYDNRLLCFDEDTEELTCIFTDQHNYFGLHYDHRMKDCRMIGDWLFFNPRVSEPKMIDVVRAYNYEQALNNLNGYSFWEASPVTYSYGDKVVYYGGVYLANTVVNADESPVTNPEKWTKIGSAYQDETGLDFDSEFEYAFDVLKMPPVSRPVIAYGSDTEILSNNVRGKMFRFSYRYKYFDDTYSVYSAFSDVSLPIDDEQWDGEIKDDTSSNNYIAVTVRLHSPALVKGVEIIFQEIDGDWKRCKAINRIETDELLTNNFTFNFYNNEVYYEVVDSTLVYKIEDTVPKTAAAQEIINKNILTYGRCKEGFDNLDKNDVDVTLTPVLQPLPTQPGIATFKRNNLTNDISNYYDNTNGIYYTIIDVTDYAVWGVVVADMYSLLVNGSFGFITLEAGDVVSANTLATAMTDACLNTDVVATAVGSALWLGSKYMYPEVTASLFYTPVGETSNILKARGFKTGANHPFCLFYYQDKLRRWDAQTSKENLHGVGYEMLGTTVYVPTFNEVSSPLIDDTANRWEIDWTVNHLPPDGAKYWRWGYAGNTLCSWFVQYTIGSAIDGVGAEANMTVIDITPLQTIATTDNAAWNQLPQCNIESYEWEEGDRIRFITHSKNPADYGLSDVLDVLYDYEIIKQSDDGNSVYVQLIEDIVVIGIGENTIVEIYRPLKSDSKIQFYEFGELLPIIEDSSGTKVHGSLEVNQDSVLCIPASGTFRSGDVYHIYRTPSKPYTTGTTGGLVMESESWSDFYESDSWDQGKPGTETSFNERILNIIRYSYQYLQNTGINGMSTFDGDNYKELNDIYGNIVAMIEVGNTLKVYQQKKPSSILIGRQEYMGADGDVTVTVSESVLGSIRYSNTNYGTEFPESVVANNRYVYGFDVYNGTMWRDSANGIFPISGRYEEAGAGGDYKMASYFKDKAKSLMLSGIANVDVMTVWDEEYDLLYVAFRDLVNDDNNEVIVFHEPSNRWVTFADFKSTEHNGYNIILELTYDIIRGLEGGIGYEFDEDVRFAIFSIVTTGGTYNAFGLPELIIEALDVTLVVGANIELDLLELDIGAQDAEGENTYIYSSESSFEWDADEYGSSVYEFTLISNGVSTVYITSIPDWLTVTDWSGNVLSVHSTVDNEAIKMYPSSQAGAARYGSVVLSDGLNECTITVTQHESDIDVSLVAVPHAMEGQTVIGLTGYGSCPVADSDVSITFTPNHPDYMAGSTIHVDYTITKNSINVGSGTITCSDETQTSRVLTMSSPSASEDVIIVYMIGQSIPV